MEKRILYIGVCRDNLEAHYPSYPQGIFLQGSFSDEQLLATISDNHINILMVDVLPRPFSPESLRQMEGQIRLINLSYQSIESLIDVELASKYGIAVGKLPADLYSEEVAEFAVTQLLSACKETILFDASLKRGVWNQAAGTGLSLRGKTLGLVGYGTIGRQIVRRLESWDMNILVCRRNPTRKPGHFRVTMIDCATLFRESDFIILALPGSESNRHLINEQCLASFKRSAILVNISRGEIVDESAVCRALTSGRLHRYCTDVFSREPMGTGHPLIDTGHRTILSPHVAWATGETLKKTYQSWFGRIDMHDRDDEMCR